MTDTIEDPLPKTMPVPKWAALVVANNIECPYARAMVLFNLGVRGGTTYSQLRDDIRDAVLKGLL